MNTNTQIDKIDKVLSKISKKSPLRQKMNSTGKSKTAEQRFSVMNAVSFRKKKIWTKSWRLSRKKRQALQQKKKRSDGRKLRFPSLMKKEYRNWKESQDLPPNRQKNTF